MSSISQINGFLQDRLARSNRTSVSAIEAGEWLDQEKLLNDSTTRPGLPLRRLLREGRIVGQRQEGNGRWFIERSTDSNRTSSAADRNQPRQLRSDNTTTEGVGTVYPAEVLTDILTEGLGIVFVGTAVGDRSARRQHYYSDSRNAFYKELYGAGLTHKLLTPEEDAKLIEYGIGLTDLVKNVHMSDDKKLAESSLSAGAPSLISKLRHFKPMWVCFNGMTAYKAFSGRKGSYGDIGEEIEGCHVYVVPSTSGRVATNRVLEGKTRSQWFNDFAAQVKKEKS